MNTLPNIGGSPAIIDHNQPSGYVDQDAWKVAAEREQAARENILDAFGLWAPAYDLRGLLLDRDDLATTEPGEDLLVVLQIRLAYTCQDGQEIEEAINALTALIERLKLEKRT